MRRERIMTTDDADVFKCEGDGKPVYIYILSCVSSRFPHIPLRCWLFRNPKCHIQVFFGTLRSGAHIQYEIYIWTHWFVWKLPAAFLRDQHLFRGWSGRESKPTTTINSMCTIRSDPVSVASPSIRSVNRLYMGSIMEGYRRPQRERSRSNFL